MKFLDNLGGFLFQPYKQSKKFLDNEKYLNNFKRTFFFVLYGSIILGTIMVFFILYPEWLYYGVPIGFSYVTLLFLNISQPIFLFGLFLIGLFSFLIIYFICFGSISYLIGGLISKNKYSFKEYKKYLTIIGYSICPSLIFGIITIFWMYFIEKLFIATEIFPYIDLTLNNIIFLILYFSCIIWKLIIEMRINQNFFKTSFIKSLIPEIVHFILFIGVLYLVNLFIGSLGGILQLY